MPTAYLPDRGIVRIAGEDALSWLQNLVTCDMARLEPGRAVYGALLTPQGKILFDFTISLGRLDAAGDADAIHLETARVVAPDLARRLSLYKLRAKVRIEDLSDKGLGVAVAWGEARVYQGDALIAPDPRHPALGERMLTREDSAISVGEDDALDYHAHRIALGIPQGGLDFAYGEAFPQEALMDLLGGLDFRKGCYVGQEVVSRMQHRGTARTRLVPVVFAGACPAPGAEVRAGEKAVGTMGTSARGRGLATLRLDRVEEALAAGASLMAADTVLTLDKPGWWTAPWPQAA